MFSSKSMKTQGDFQRYPAKISLLKDLYNDLHSGRNPIQLSKIEYCYQVANLTKSCYRIKNGEVKEKFLVAQFDTEAIQTRDYCVAKNATRRAARPSFTAQRTLVQ